MTIEYKINAPVTTEQFLRVLETSTLGERRPVQDRACSEHLLRAHRL